MWMSKETIARKSLARCSVFFVRFAAIPTLFEHKRVVYWTFDGRRRLYNQ